jgi:hypothetical protein
MIRFLKMLSDYGRLVAEQTADPCGFRFIKTQTADKEQKQ